MVRKLALSLAVAAAMGTSQALALGLGEIRVNSALNEPLNAEIQLLQVRDLSPLQIRPRMADVDEFSLAGLTKSRFLSDVKFQVQIGPNGQGTISVSSSVPVQEPFLSFLMEVNWPSGRLVREYTLLLDPPVFDPAPTTTVINTPTAPAQSAPAPTPRAAAPASNADARTVRTDMNRASEIYVDVNDTLYVIARDNRPAGDISIEQMMIALQRKNPQAFPTSNINIMKAGTVMKLPTADEARALTRKQAIAEAARQTAEWKAGRRAAAPAPAPETTPAAEGSTDSGKPSSGTGDATAESGDSQLTIVAPSEESAVSAEEAAAADASGDAAQQEMTEEQPTEEAQPTEREVELTQKNEELENRLLMTQESVTAVERENAELGDKLDSIQEQLMSLQRLIELKDQQMAALQEEMLRQAQEANKPKPSAIDDLINTLMENPLYLGGAGGVLVLLLALLALKRRKPKDDEEAPAPRKSRKGKKSKKEQDTDDSIPEFDEEPAIAPVAAAAAGAGIAAAAMADDREENLDELNDDLDDLDLDMDLDLDEEPIEDAVDDSPLEDISVTGEAADAEAEIDSMLDDILDEGNEEDDLLDATTDDLDDLLDSDLDTDIDELSVTDEDLEAEMAELAGAEEPEETEVSAELEDDDLDFSIAETPAVEEEVEVDDEDDLEGLEFAVSEEEELPETQQDDGDFIDDSFFEPEIPEATGAVDPSPEVKEDDLLDEMMDEDARPPGADLVSVDENLDDLLDDDLDKMLADSAVAMVVDEAKAEEDAVAPDLQPQAEEEPVIEDDSDLGELTFDIDDGLESEEPKEEAVVAESEASFDEDELLDSMLDMDLPDENEAPAAAVASAAPQSDESDDLDLDELLGEPSFEMDDLDALESETPESTESPEMDVEEDSLEDALLAAEPEVAFEEEADVEADEIDELDELGDLDDLIKGLDSEEDSSPRKKTPGEIVEDELTANIAHDLDLSLDDELDGILDSTDSDVELVEEGDDDLGDEFEMDSGLELLDGADEVETKLDLARAYIEMDDLDGARDILNEVKRDGSDTQQSEAQKLLDKLS